MPSPRFDKLPLERQREILDVAGRHFAADGLDGASVARILADCGLTRGAAYYYFVDKHDLFATVFEQGWRDVQTGSNVDFDSLTAEDFWVSLGRLYRHQIVSFRDRPWLWTLGRSARVALAHPVHGPALSERLGRTVSAMLSVVTIGQQLGVVRTDLPQGLLVSMFESLDDGIDTWLVEHADQVAGPEGLVLIDRCFETLRGLLEPRDGRAS